MLDPQFPAAILVAGNVRLFRDALAHTLGSYPEFSVLGTVDSSEEVLAFLATTIPQMVVFDAAMTGALDLVRVCARSSPTPRFVAVAVTESEQAVLEWAEAGIAGYVQREGSVNELIRTLAHVQRGELVCSPRVTASLFRRLAALSAAASPVEAVAAGALTQRECEIATLLDSGLSNKEIARELGIEVATVKNHVHNILEKLHVHRRADAAAHLRSATARYTPGHRLAAFSRPRPGV